MIALVLAVPSASVLNPPSLKISEDNLGTFEGQPFPMDQLLPTDPATPQLSDPATSQPSPSRSTKAGRAKAKITASRSRATGALPGPVACT